MTPAVTGVISGTSISVDAGSLPQGTVKTALIASWSASDGATVAVKGVAQTSGSTANDFTTPVTYTVTAENGTTKDFTVTVKILFSGVKAIAVGPSNGGAIKTDGSVWIWGDNNGDKMYPVSSNINRVLKPTRISTITATTASALSFGTLHVAALVGGSVFTWGMNEGGQLGVADTTIRSTSLQTGPTNVSALAANVSSNAAILTDQTVVTWGANSNGQLGNGGTIASLTYRAASGKVQAAGPADLTGITNVAVGPTHMIAVKSDGTVWVWGKAAYGTQSGVDSSFAVQVIANVLMPGSVFNGVSKVAAGDMHNVALKSDGTVWTWGSNAYAQLGNGTPGTTNGSLSPINTGLTGVKAIAAGGSHTLALKTDGTVWAWGNNTQGQIGTNSTANYISVPTQIPGLSGITAIAAGGYVSFALTSNGNIYSWGYNGDGTLGTDSQTGSKIPVLVQDQ